MELPAEYKQILEHIAEGEVHDQQLVEEAKDMLKKISRGDHVCLMKKALYGLKQAGRAWNERLDGGPDYRHGVYRRPPDHEPKEERDRQAWGRP